MATQNIIRYDKNTSSSQLLTILMQQAQINGGDLADYIATEL